MNAILIFLVKLDEPHVLRRLTAQARAADNRGIFTQCRRELEARIAQGFARGHQRELGEAIEQVGAAGVEMFPRIEPANLGAVRKSQFGEFDGFQWCDAGAPFAESAREFRRAFAQGADYTQAGDGDAARRHGSQTTGFADSREVESSAAFAASRRTPSTTSRTLRSERACSSEIET